MQQASSPIVPLLPRRVEEIPATHDWFREMREQRPVAEGRLGPLPVWNVFRYEDAAAVLTDHARFSSRSMGAQGSFLADTLVAKDPPDHRKLRSLINLAFTPRAVAGLADRIAAITQRLLDRVKPAGEMDLVADLAFPLPARVIGEMLGVPDEDWDLFQRFAHTPDALRGEMERYFALMLEDRRRSPREDLVSALSRAEDDGQRLTERELVSFCFLLLLAGQETTKNLIANFFLTMGSHPDEHATLMREPELIPGAIEEVLRWLPPVCFVSRQTTTEVELSGVRIPAGQAVMPWMVSANRDRAQFPDPDTFDIRREPNRHLTFGHGIHFCVGAPLARLETRVALPMLLEQLGPIRVVPDVPIGVNVQLVFMVDSLPVTFQAVA